MISVRNALPHQAPPALNVPLMLTSLAIPAITPVPSNTTLFLQMNALLVLSQTANPAHLLNV